MKINQMRVQGLNCPLGISTRQPLLSYCLKETGHGDKCQSAFRLLAATTRELLDNNIGDLWDSGIWRQRETFGIVYGGKKLQSRQRVYWKVMVWDEKDNCMGWSETSFWEMGLLEKKDWLGRWIGQGDARKDNNSNAPLFTREFRIEDRNCIAGARLYISGLGIYQASLNGGRISDTLFEPGESDTTKTVYYRTYDVLDGLKEGENVLGVILGNGQYTNFQINPVMALPDGTLLQEHRYQKNDGGFVKPGISGNKKLIAQLEIMYNNGKRQIVLVSDLDWKWTDGPTVFQNWYGGEDYDAIKEISGWDMPETDRTEWVSVQEMETPKGDLAAAEFPPVRIMERIIPKEIKKLSNGHWLVDMGRNGAGFPEIHIDTTEDMRGKWIKMYPAELLREDENGVNQASCTQSWNDRYQCVIQDAYRIRGTGEETWHPSFCYQGFQYLEIDGWQGELTKDAISFCIVRIANKKTGSFYSSSPLLNKISEMVENSIESNMFFAFTDCPQIEKLGWIETSHLMFRSLADCYDINAWMRKIIYDIMDAQVDEEQAQIPGNEPVGYVPAIIPEYQRIVGLHRDPNWNGACIFTPWEYYCFYGDEGILRQAYPVMQRYLSYLMTQLNHGVLEGYAQMGEWGELSEHTPNVLVATCSYYRMLCIMVRIAKLLGMEQDVIEYHKKAQETKQAFFQNRECYDSKTGIYGSGSQASYGCVLFSDMVSEEQKQAVVQQLVEAVEQNDYHISSGEVGLKQVFVSLAENGRNDVVYRMIMNKTAPSYRFFVEKGFSTLPEYWNCDELWMGMERSRNHAMMGHVKEWISRYMLGIRPIEPAFRKIRIAPWLPDGMREIKGSICCPFGKISIECIREREEIIVKTDIPPGVIVCR